MDSTLFRFIWRHSQPQQIFILAVTFLSFPLIYYSLDLPKTIVNEAMQGEHWPQPILGFQLEQISYLLVLCFAFLGVVVVNNGIKYFINTYKNALGERMARRLRYELYQRVLRFRLPRFRQVSQGEIIPMITSEIEPLGGYIGDAIALPAFQGGTLLVYLYFIFAQDLFLGIAAIAFYPLQMWLIPKLQARVNQLARKRVLNTRRMADRIGETISGVRDVHANDASAWHMADLSERLYLGFEIRFRWLQLKYMIKFVNNVINQLTPFFFYSIGGYLVIQGELSFGALVAVLAAYKDLAGPWRELLDFYQTRADVEIKYQTVIENFDVPDVKPVDLLVEDAAPDDRLEGDIVLRSVSFGAPGSQEISDISVEIPVGSRVAVVGEDTDGRGELLELIAGLNQAKTGAIAIGGRNLETLPESVLGRSIAYVGSTPYVFTETIRGNLCYGLRHRPQVSDDWADTPEQRRRVDEARRTGNTEFPVGVPWDDLEEAGVADHAELETRALEVLDVVGLGDDVFRLGLSARIDPAAEAAPVDALIAARKAVRARIAGDQQAADLVELWDSGRMNNNATLAENVLFALPADSAIRMGNLPRDRLVMRFLEEAGLFDEFVDMGLEIARAMVELFAQVSADSDLLAEFSFITLEDLPLYDRLIKRLDKEGDGELAADERVGLIGLAFELVPARHRLDVMTAERERRIVEARPLFRRLVEADGNGRFVPFDADLFIAPLSIEDNVLFGKIRLDRRGSREKVDAIIRSVIKELGLSVQIQKAGLDFHVGVGGSRLSPGQRQKIALARALMKRPRYAILDGLIIDERLVEALRRELDGRTLVVGVPRLEHGRPFDLVLMLRNGRLAAQGSFEEVARTATAA